MGFEPTGDIGDLQITDSSLPGLPYLPGLPARIAHHCPRGRRALRVAWSVPLHSQNSTPPVSTTCAAAGPRTWQALPECYNCDRALLRSLAACRSPRLRRSRGNTTLEVLALRQRVAVLKRKRLRPSVGRLDLLDRSPTTLAPLDRRSRRREARDRRRLAPHRFSSVLALAIPWPPLSAECQRRGPRSCPAAGGSE